ncbi:hypothetical Protein pso3_04600 [Candidatus Phytoplasma solani]
MVFIFGLINHQIKKLKTNKKPHIKEIQTKTTKQGHPKETLST